MTKDIVEVAVAVLVNENNKVLLNSRPQGKPYAGFWEFPGGKIEAGESVQVALARELKEELNITLRDSTPWLIKEHQYEHAFVRLYFRISRHFSGLVQSCEGQDFGFFGANEKTPGAILPASAELVKRAQMPEFFVQNSDYKIINKDTLFSIVERKAEVKYLGAKVSTKDEILKAKALDLDFVVVTPEDFDKVLYCGYPMLPTYVTGTRSEDLKFWQSKGAVGIY